MTHTHSHTHTEARAFWLHCTWNRIMHIAHTQREPSNTAHSSLRALPVGVERFRLKVTLLPAKLDVSRSLFFSFFFFSFHFVSTQQTLTIFTLAAYPSSCHSPFSCLAICPSSIIGQTGWQAAVYLFDYHLNRHCRKTFCCAFSKTATPSV